MKGFIEFIREQGVVGFAVGFILGGAISAVVASLVTDIINPVISGLTSGASQLYLHIGSSRIMYGNFLGAIINFVILAFIVYFGVKLMRLDKLDAKEKK